MEKDKSRKVFTEIAGKASWAGVEHGMRMMSVENDSEFRKYWMRPGSEIPDGTHVQVGDQLGLEGDIPMVILIGALRYKFSKKIPIKSHALYTIEGDCLGADGRYYILRMRFMLRENGEEYGDQYYLEQETLEETFYRADDSILAGRKISTVASLYGFHENEIPSFLDETPLHEWLEGMHQQKRIQFNSPYDILNCLHYRFDNFKLVFERRSLGIIVTDEKEIKNEKKEKNVREQYRDAAMMVIDRDPEYCTRFIIENAIPCPEEFEPDSQGAKLMSLLVERYEAKEDYDTCEKLFRLQNGFKFKEWIGSTELADFVRNGEAVLNFEKYILICWKKIELLGMLALAPHVKKKHDDIDSLLLVEMMLDYFRQKGKFKECEKLTLMKQRIQFKRQADSQSRPSSPNEK